MPFQSLAKWVQVGAFMLAMNAGMIHVLGLISLVHQSVSHMTGNASLLALDFAAQNYSSVVFLILVILSDVLGSSYSGFIWG